MISVETDPTSLPYAIRYPLAKPSLGSLRVWTRFLYF